MNSNHILMRKHSLEIEDLAMLNPVELVGYTLYLAIIAPHQSQAEMAAKEAQTMSAQHRLSKEETERSKSIAKKMVDKHGLDAIS